MPDERQDSIRQGIHAPEESPEGRAAAEARRRRNAESPEIGGAMGGTSDADAPADETLYRAQEEAARQEAARGDSAHAESGGEESARAGAPGAESDREAAGRDEREASGKIPERE